MRTVIADKSSRVSSQKANGLSPSASYGYVTVAEYLIRERTASEKSEYIAGEMRKTAGASRARNLLALKIVRLLGDIIEARGGEIYGSEMRVSIPIVGVVTYPDVAIVLGEKPRFGDARVDTLLNPIVIVEVLSPSTAEYDSGDNFAHYRVIPSLQEYVLVSQDRPRIEVFRRESERRRDWTLSVAEGVDASATLQTIDASLDLVNVYSQITFSEQTIDDRDTPKPA